MLCPVECGICLCGALLQGEAANQACDQHAGFSHSQPMTLLGGACHLLAACAEAQSLRGGSSPVQLQDVPLCGTI